MNERELEKKHLTKTLDIIQNEQEILQKQRDSNNASFQEQLKEITDQKIKIGSDESFYESVIDYQQHEQELVLRYQTAESQEKRIRTLKTMADTPYFARIDFKEGIEPKETLYLGIASLRDSHDSPIVIDWRAPIANLYYEGELGTAYYETKTDRFTVDLLLKRQFKIQEGQLLSLVDTSEMINDEFLLDILDEASSAQMKNIVSTIQKAQNQIIRDTHSKYLLIEGIAGSGKTSALLQRIAYLLYHHRQWLNEKELLLFSPNHLFSDYIARVLPSLGESEVPTQTFRSFLNRLLPQFKIIQRDQQEEAFLANDEDKIERLKSGTELIDEITAYGKKIAQHGPLFRDLKIKGQCYIKKENLRQWYQETNQLLPVYQRTQLLQEKVFKKIAGLEKDEAKKDWVKKAAEEKLEQAFQNDPNLEYTEEKERQLLRKFRKQIAHKKFHFLSRGVAAYQFINLPKQYVHFLSQIPNECLSHARLSVKEWQDSLKKVQMDFKNRELTQPDALLYFLLMKQLYPVYVTEKARFIFIDEMQDFPPAQVALLRKLYPNASFTLCGDLNQKVFDNETIVNHLDELFPTDSVTHYKLTTSYRSTKEITDFSNQLLTRSDMITTTARQGKLPAWVHFTNQDQSLAWLVKQLVTLQNDHRFRTAIIAKTTKECENLYEKLDDKTRSNVQLIVSEEAFLKRTILIIPAFLAKGLEFDRVFAWNVGSNFASDKDQLILYTMTTRAMHELTLLSQETCPLEAKIATSSYLSIEP